MPRKFYLLLLYFLLLLPTCLLAQNATIKGQVKDAGTKELLIGASIHVDGLLNGVVTNTFGAYTLNNLKPGSYKIKATYIGYNEFEKEVTVTANQELILDISLSANLSTLRTVSVFGKYNAEEEYAARAREKNAANITNVISAQAMLRSPDINAANVLQRMSGITVQRSSGGDEAYAVIRGMEPRYNNTLINGIKIASPSDKSRFIPLDIIPSDLLSSIVISKSLLPSMEGDAIGGTVNLVVKDAPDTLSFKALGSIGYSQLYLDQKFRSFDASMVQAKSPIARKGTGYVAQIGDFSKGNLDFRSQNAPVNYTAGITYSQRFLKNKLGILLADNLQSQYFGAINQLSTVDLVNPYASYKVQKITQAERFYADHQTNNGLVTHIDYIFNDRNRINVNNIFIYNRLAESFAATDTTLSGDGRKGPGTGTFANVLRSTIQTQTIENLKLSGWHKLSDNLLVEWAGVISDAQKKEPDRAEIVSHTRINLDLTRSGNVLNYVDRTWQQNSDRDYTGLLDLTYHAHLLKKDLELKAGGLYRKKTRFNQQDYYRLLASNPPLTIGDWSYSQYHDQLTVKNVSGSLEFDPNNYQANEQVAAGYLQGKLELAALQVIGGLRLENTNQGYDIPVTSGYVSLIPAHTAISYLDVLPSVALKYRLDLKQNLRLSYFKSISRPNYFELVPSRLPVGNFIQVGNPSLKHATADNLDLRYELFPKGEEQFFAGVFYKRIQNPIEYALKRDSNTAGVSTAQLVYKPQNFGTAYNYGLELAYTKYWGDIGITGNYTYTHSALTSKKFLYYKSPGAPNLPRPSNDTLYVNETRPMQGQSNHIVNLSLLFKSPKYGLFAQLSYGYIGKTLTEVSSNYNADYYQRPMSTMSFSAEKDVKKYFTVFGKFNNLLNTVSNIYSQDILVERNMYKASYNIGIRYTH